MGELNVVAEQATGRGSRGLVLAASPVAAAIGAEIIRSGGNAYDGAVAAALVETVTLPSKCGLAGDVVAITRTAGESAPRCLLAIGECPVGLPAAADRVGLQSTGPLSVGVPGAPAGYAALAGLAVRDLADLVAPAAEVARSGFVWAAVNHALAVEARDLVSRVNDTANRYFPDGQPISTGSVVRLPGLALVLDQFASRGPDLFHGPVGESLVDYVQRHGGVIEAEDLVRVRAEWVAPAEIRVEGRSIWATPAPTFGSALLDALSDGPRDALAAARRGLASRELLADTGTSIVSAADPDGNMVVLVHSLSFPRYGSGLVLPDFDLILSNRPGRGFSPDPAHPNYPALGRRPATTLHAWGVSDQEGRLAFLGGTPGGENQVTWNVQTILELLAGEKHPGKLVTNPRFEIGPDGIVAEEGARLREPARVVPRWGLSCAQQVMAVPRPGGAVVGAVDPRSGGLAVPV